MMSFSDQEFDAVTLNRQQKKTNIWNKTIMRLFVCLNELNYTQDSRSKRTTAQYTPKESARNHDGIESKWLGRCRWFARMFRIRIRHRINWIPLRRECIILLLRWLLFLVVVNENEWVSSPGRATFDRRYLVVLPQPICKLVWLVFNLVTFSVR